MAELQIERSKLIEGARSALREIEIHEEVISRLDDVIDEERRSVYSVRRRLEAILRHAGIDLPSDPGDYEHAAARFVKEAERDQRHP
jgi:hypothetical protein